VLSAKFALQVPGQVIPDGLLVTVPAVDGTPIGKYPTVRVELEEAVKVGVIVIAVVTVMTQLLTPEQAPLHPLKEYPWSAVAVNVTFMPVGNVAWQTLLASPPSPLHSMPAGVLVMTPVFAGGAVTVT
jgi:hypothetical protein